MLSQNFFSSVSWIEIVSILFFLGLIYVTLIHILYYFREKTYATSTFWLLTTWIATMPFMPCNEIFRRLVREKMKKTIHISKNSAYPNSIFYFFLNTRSTYFMRNFLIVVDLIGLIISSIPAILEYISGIRVPIPVLDILGLDRPLILMIFSFSITLFDFYMSTSKP